MLSLPLRGTLPDVSLEASQRVQLFIHRRSPVEVAADMLRVRGSQTAIMYDAQLSYTQTQKYLRQLCDMALIESVEQRNGRPLYGLTGKGQEFLDLFDRMKVLMGRPEPLTRGTALPPRF